MKKSLGIILACVLMLGALSYAKAEPMDQEDAWKQAFALVAAQTGSPEQRMHKGQIEFENGQWTFSVLIDDETEDGQNLLIGQMDEQGNLFSLEDLGSLSMDQLLERDLKACFHRDDSYLRLAEMCDKWKPILQGLTNEERDLIFEKYISVVELEITQPDENPIPYEKAYQIALEKLAVQPNWSMKQANMFQLVMSAYYIPEDISRAVYFFSFKQHSSFEEAYSTEKAMSQYEKELERTFDGVAPWQFSLMIDAQSGELVALPVFDYAPVQFHYLDFLIRTDEFKRVENGV